MSFCTDNYCKLLLNYLIYRLIRVLSRQVLTENASVKWAKKFTEQQNILCSLTKYGKSSKYFGNLDPTSGNNHLTIFLTRFLLPMTKHLLICL